MNILIDWHTCVLLFAMRYVYDLDKLNESNATQIDFLTHAMNMQNRRAYPHPTFNERYAQKTWRRITHYWIYIAWPISPCSSPHNPYSCVRRVYSQILIYNVRPILVHRSNASWKKWRAIQLESKRISIIHIIVCIVNECAFCVCIRDYNM